jgi:hypothetical protein
MEVKIARGEEKEVQSYLLHHVASTDAQER